MGLLTENGNYGFMELQSSEDSWLNNKSGIPRSYNAEPAVFLNNDSKYKHELNNLLKGYILKKCMEYQHCCESDFDSAALEALCRMPHIQALQTVEHYATSVSERILKKSAYLMGILHGQQSHWGKVNSQLKSSCNLFDQLLLCIGTACLKGNCTPSDFTPEVCQKLDCLPVKLGFKAVGAFNNNKRIVAGVKGGVINRSRFFLRLIQNVAEQSQTTQLPHLSSEMSSYSGSEGGGAPTKRISHTSVGSRTSQPPPPLLSREMNLEQLADIDFHSENKITNRVNQLEIELQHREKREQILMSQVRQLETRLHLLQTECSELRKAAMKQEQDIFFDSFNKY